MSKKNTNVMTCGCVAIVEENGRVTTNVDKLVKGVSRLFSRSTRRHA